MRGFGMTLLGLSLLAAATWWLQERSTPERHSGDRAHVPDQTAYGIQVTLLGQEGLPSRHLLATSLTHYPDDDSTELTAPVLTVFSQGHPPWVIHSETAWIGSEGDMMLLHGEVTMDREAGPALRPFHVRTREVRVETPNDYAETDEFVFAHSTDDWVTGFGMQLWFGEPMRLKLLNQVRGRYDVKNP
ncbi:MAG: LPS export ABC transporter periplasmic protein LptC [Pseudomonadota bacterium]